LCGIQDLPNEQTVKSANKELLEVGEKLMQVQLKIDAIQSEKFATQKRELTLQTQSLIRQLDDFGARIVQAKKQLSNSSS